MEEFFAIVSEDLKTEQATNTIIIVLQIIEPSMWMRLEESSRIRIENMIIKSIRDGEMQSTSKTQVVTGALGTWSKEFFPFFTLRKELKDEFINKLGCANQHERRYISNFYLDAFPKIFISDDERKRCTREISWSIKKGGRNFIEDCFSHFGHYPSNWQNEILVSLQGEPDSDALASWLPDGTYFLEKFIKFDDIDSEDDIPF